MMVDVFATTSMSLDTTYTAKTVQGLVGEMQKSPGRFHGKKVLFIHTGQLSGIIVCTCIHVCTCTLYSTVYVHVFVKIGCAKEYNVVVHVFVKIGCSKEYNVVVHVHVFVKVGCAKEYNVVVHVHVFVKVGCAKEYNVVVQYMYL